MKTFPLSRRMIISHMRIIMAKGYRPKTNLDIYKTLADPKIALKIKLYRVRRWQGKTIS